MGEIELNGVASRTEIRPEALGQVSGNGVRSTCAELSSWANPAIPGDTSFMIALIFCDFVTASSEAIKRPREIASATSKDALDRLIRT
jgi:hypothetical protein